MFSCSTSNSNRGRSNFVEGKGYCVHKYGDNGCSCSYEHGEDSFICLSGPSTDCDDNKDKAGECIKYVPDLKVWIEEVEKQAADDSNLEPASISNK